MTHLLATWSVAFLLGGMTLFSLVVAPLVFLRLPTEQAGRFIRALFPWYYLYVLVTAGLATLWLSLTPGREALAWTLLLIFVSAIYARQGLMPEINRLRDAAEAGDAMAGATFRNRHTRSVWLNGAQWLVALTAAGLLAGGPPERPAPTEIAAGRLLPAEDCQGFSGWLNAAGRVTHLGSLIDAHRRQRVWLLGERHDDPAHHAWQLQVLSALHARAPGLAIGMEMFPREAQPALDAWVAGHIDWPTLLATSDWDAVWGFPAELYRPVLEFARRNRVPIVALNLHPDLIRQVSTGGFKALPSDLRAALGKPAQAPRVYRTQLAAVHAYHPGGLSTHEPRQAVPEADAADPAMAAGDDSGATAPAADAGVGSLQRFIEVQLTWDRAMAAAIHATLAAPDGPTHVVTLVGGGHVGRDRGIPLQLADLGLTDTVSLLPAAPSAACPGPEGAELAVDARFILPPVAEQTPTPAGRPRLGVALGTDTRGARILAVEPGSLAEREGLAVGDIILELAGHPCESPEQVVAAVRGQPPGTWLPITIQRGEERREQVLRFPNRP
ncbi:MAG TPA: hypothetical protein DCY89_03250 [Gammaproteobacteria bacterium]|nr:hypothetical protein [Gammaproteobacteria bacterium]